MEKDFDKWNDKKKKINSTKQKFYVKQREIWSVNMGKNVGFEEDGKGDDFERPVLVLKKIGIMYLCISMTTQGKNNDFYYKLQDIEELSFIILSQAKLFDLKRFHYKIRTVTKNEFLEVQKNSKHYGFKPFLIFTLNIQGVPKEICTYII